MESWESWTEDLGSAHESCQERFIEIALGQYQLAIEQREITWIDVFRRACKLYMPAEVIERRFPLVNVPQGPVGSPIFAMPRRGEAKRTSKGPSDVSLRSRDVSPYRPEKKRIGPSNVLPRSKDRRERRDNEDLREVLSRRQQDRYPRDSGSMPEHRENVGTGIREIPGSTSGIGRTVIVLV